MRHALLRRRGRGRGAADGGGGGVSRLRGCRSPLARLPAAVGEAQVGRSPRPARAALPRPRQAQRAELAAWERASAEARSKGLFFKNLYAPQPGTAAGGGGGGEGASASASVPAEAGRAPLALQAPPGEAGTVDALAAAVGSLAAVPVLLLLALVAGAWLRRWWGGSPGAGAPPPPPSGGGGGG
jgi:hypothetical protein